MLRNLVLREIRKAQLVKKGDFVLKNGEKTETYLDIRAIISSPKSFSFMTQALASLIHNHIPDQDVALCGVPYGALPFATALSLNMSIPLIILRETRKKYGLKNIIVGANSVPRNIILIEDVVTTGASALEAVKTLKEEGYNVVMLISIVLRNPAQQENLRCLFPYYSLFTMDELITDTPEQWESCGSHLDPRPRVWREAITRKGTNIVLAYDQPDVNKLFNLMKCIGDKIIGLKIHSEILSMSKAQEARLIKLCKQNTIFLWEDRKMNDIAATVEKQMKKYERTRDFISIVPTSGPHVLAIPSSLGFFVVAEMSSASNCFTSSVSAQIAAFIDMFPYNVCGIICQDELWFDLPFLSIKPGISNIQRKDGQGQQYSTTAGNKPDLFVIGRAIVDCENPEKAIEYFLK